MCDENHMIGKTVNTMLSPVVPVFLYFVPESVKLNASQSTKSLYF